MEKEQLDSIVKLAQIIAERYDDCALIGIITDGVPIARCIEHYFNVYYRKQIEVDYIGASSKLKFVDEHKLEQLKEKHQNRIFLDWRTVTGKLGEMIHEKDREGIYAVLSDPNKKADISATVEDIPKLRLPENYEDTMRLIGVWTEPHTMAGLLRLKAFGGKIDYKLIETSQSKQFYTELFESLI